MTLAKPQVSAICATGFLPYAFSTIAVVMEPVTYNMVANYNKRIYNKYDGNQADLGRS
jgi:hypothetical protein